MLDRAPHSMPKETGWIEVIAGCMFSGKTEELIRRLRRAKIAKQNVKIFKPRIDNRYSHSDIVSHSEQSLPSILIDDINEVLKYSDDAEVIGIDEAQFFSSDIVEICNKLANEGKFRSNRCPNYWLLPSILPKHWRFVLYAVILPIRPKEKQNLPKE